MNKTGKIALSILVLIIIIGVISWWTGRRNTPDMSKHIDVSELILYKNENVPFRLHYSSKLQIHRESVSDTTGWSHSTAKKGELLVQLKLKPSVQPKTNLSEAFFTVGRSRNAESLKKCMSKTTGYMIQADTIQRNGETYFRTKYSGAGAGNYYNVIQYRAIRGNYCYSIEELVHTTNIHNYPPERGISLFDSSKVWGTLEAVWQSFQFTQ